ncbi:MAG: sensor domain-containing diguanylate cyclase [Deltaproteobacteria bacterium]|nr:sensor domain-containing diguanylate cyclase [Deltaproteobacteria bacterium]
MPPRHRPRKKDPAVRRHIIPAVSLAHLSLFLLAWRWSGGSGRAALLPVSAAAAFAGLLARDFFTSRRKDRLPDIPAMLAWGGAALLEAGVCFPGFSETRIAPAILFPSFACFLPSIPAAAYAALASAWLLFSPDGEWPAVVRIASIAGLGVFGTFAGRIARSKIPGSPQIGGPMDGGIREARPAEVPWENGKDAEGDAEFAAERVGLVRSREDLMEGVLRILEGVLPVIGAERIHFLFPSPGSGGSFRVGASAFRGGCRGAESGVVSIPGDYIPVREAMLLRRTFIAEGEEAGKWRIPRRDGESGVPTGVAAAPVRIGEKAECAILAVRFAEGGWDGPAGQILEMAAFLAARELARARRQNRMDRYLAEQEGFHLLVRKIAEVSERREGEERESISMRKEVYKVAVEQARRHLDAGRVLFVEASADGRRGRIGWETGGLPGAGEEWVSLDGTYAEWVLKQGVHRMFGADHGSSGRHPVLPQAWSGDQGRGYLLVPVPEPGGFRGILACEACEGRRFEGEDAEAAKDILAIMRMGISHAMRLENLEREAKIDGLTGLLNRKTFHERLVNVLSRMDGRYPCAVVMLDIDHFKRINDTYGHPAGDEVLRKVSGVIGKTVRKADMAGRYGGEEFSIYLHSIDEAHAVMFSERLRLIIRQTRFVFGGKEVFVTASMGIACHPAHGMTGEELMRQADEALYLSKQGGRDRTTVYIKR